MAGYRDIQGLFVLVLFILVACSVQSPHGADGYISLQEGEGAGRPAPGKVAYGIMVYQRTGKPVDDVYHQFKRLFDALYSDRFTYVVHVDIKSENRLIEAISTYLKGFPNAYQIPSVSVSWAGVTVVERTLALMQEALEVDSEWEYFVNVGQDDYPLANPEEIMDTLSQAEEGTNFIYCWDLGGHDFFGQWERHDRRVTKVFVDFFDGKAQEMRKTFRKTPEEFHFYKSLQQTTLSRSFVEYACYSSMARRLLLFLANSQAPDEIFFPTLLFTDQRFSNKATCDTTLHFSHWIRPGGSWHPEYLTPLHLPLLLDKRDEGLDKPYGPPLYARKVDESKGSRRLLDVLDRLRDCPNARERGMMDWIVPLLFDDKKKSGAANTTTTTTSVTHFDKCDLEGLSAHLVYDEEGGEEVLRGHGVLRSLDKARRVHDADLIMAFISDYEKKTGHLIRAWKQPEAHHPTAPPLPSTRTEGEGGGPRERQPPFTDAAAATTADAMMGAAGANRLVTG